MCCPLSDIHSTVVRKYAMWSFAREKIPYVTRSLVASEGWSLVRDRTNRKHCPSHEIWSYKRDGRWWRWSFDRGSTVQWYRVWYRNVICITGSVCGVAFRSSYSVENNIGRTNNLLGTGLLCRLYHAILVFCFHLWAVAWNESFFKLLLLYQKINMDSDRNMLIELVDKIYCHSDEKYTVGVFLDISKAFDTI